MSECLRQEPPGSSVHGVSQARRLEWVAISFSGGSSRPRDGSCISCIGRRTLPQSHLGSPKQVASPKLNLRCTAMKSSRSHLTQSQKAKARGDRVLPVRAQLTRGLGALSAPSQALSSTNPGAHLTGPLSCDDLSSISILHS